MSVAVQQMAFDYASLDNDTRVFVQEKAQSIHTRLKRTAEDVIAIGLDLIEVKDKLPYGDFQAWLLFEFDMTYRTAVNFMRVAKRFANRSEIISLPVTILYELAAPSTPDTVIEMVESGQIPPTLSAIREAKHVDPATLSILKPEPEPIYGPVYPDYVHPLERGLYDAFAECVAREQAQGGSIVRPPVETDRGVHDEDPFSRFIAMVAVDRPI